MLTDLGKKFPLTTEPFNVAISESSVAWLCPLARGCQRVSRRGNTGTRAGLRLDSRGRALSCLVTPSHDDESEYPSTSFDAVVYPSLRRRAGNASRRKSVPTNRRDHVKVAVHSPPKGGPPTDLWRRARGKTTWVVIPLLPKSAYAEA